MQCVRSDLGRLPHLRCHLLPHLLQTSLPPRAHGLALSKLRPRNGSADGFVLMRPQDNYEASGMSWRDAFRKALQALFPLRRLPGAT